MLWCRISEEHIFFQWMQLLTQIMVNWFCLKRCFRSSRVNNSGYCKNESSYYQPLVYYYTAMATDHLLCSSTSSPLQVFYWLIQLSLPSNLADLIKFGYWANLETLLQQHVSYQWFPVSPSLETMFLLQCSLLWYLYLIVCNFL